MQLASMQALRQLHEQAGNHSLQMSQQSGVFDANMELFKFNQVRTNRLTQRMMVGKKTGLYGNRKAGEPLPRMLYHQFSDFSATQPAPTTVHRYPSNAQNRMPNTNSLEAATLSEHATEPEHLPTENNLEKEDGRKNSNFDATQETVIEQANYL